LLGAKPITILGYIRSFLNGKGLQRALSYRQMVGQQALCFQRHYSGKLTADDESLFNKITNIVPSNGPISMFIILVISGLRPQGIRFSLALFYSSFFNTE